MGTVTRQAFDGSSASAFENIVTCHCGHGVGNHDHKGCSACDCDWNSDLVIDWAIQQDRIQRALLSRSDLRPLVASLMNRYPGRTGAPPSRRYP
jgi:hypothetical protein